MKLSIITINYNNAEGLRKTLASVAAQTYADIEHVIVDGGSTDGSVEIIEAYPQPLPEGKGVGLLDKYPHQNPMHKVIWVSEKDSGIYNAMNKGIRMATGEYIEILNSGDILAAPDVTDRMVAALEAQQCKVESGTCKGAENSEADDHASTPYTLHLTPNSVSEPASSPKKNRPAIFYGNMIKEYPDGRRVKDTCGDRDYTPKSFYYFYRGTLNHDCAYIRRDLFEKYGLYNEQMKICSDWEWYVRAIVLGGEKTVYTNIDVTVFDMTGISESDGKNKDIILQERREYFESILPAAVLRDYDMYSLPIEQYRRLKKYHLWGVVYFVERVLFKFEKWFK